ncbi:hypothetical protein B5807_01688 [Epicoccum nigrum]|uniref:Uncharacterized protein n=1 Tax=Epicoccum nigrum TaxID=105696 RepID=A0A1Y2MD89_EPING|nr:hypothetical protein B5807_01688 [Epicoccum nigrum]
MSSSTEFHEDPIIVDLYRPVLCPNPAVRIHVLLRRACEHQQAIESKIFGLTPSDNRADAVQWLSENEQFIQDEKLRMKVCLDQLEDHLRHHPETPIKGEFEILQMHYRGFCIFLSDRTTESKSLVQGT